jgi:ATP:ADP antiporter, AAA family
MAAQSRKPGRFMSAIARIEPGEGPAVLVAFLMYFCILGGYFAVRPVRETVGTVLGRERVADLFVWTWVVTLALVPAYGALCTYFRRRVFLPIVYGAVAVALAACGVVFLGDEKNVATGTFFYVLISVFNLLLVSMLWSFLLELFRGEQVKRLFGIIAAGGTLGALAGPVMTDLLVTRIGNSGILFVGAGMFVVAVMLQQVLWRIGVRADFHGRDEGSGLSGGREGGRPPVAVDAGNVRDRAMGGNPLAGIWLVLKSPYLLGIALFVILLATVNTILYFEQLDLVAATFKDTAERTRVFSRIDYVVQSLTILSQVFLTGRAASRWGIGILLVMVPVAMIGGFLTLALYHAFPVLVVVMIARRAGEYAFVRPGREMLFSNVGLEEKYKAKNFVDVPVYRGGDALAAQVLDGLKAGGLSAVSVSILGAVIAAVWAVNGWWLGRRREHVVRAEPVPTVTGSGRAEA